MAVFGGIFGRKDKKSTNSPEPTSSPTTLKKPNPSSSHANHSSSSSSKIPRRFPSRPSLSFERRLAAGDARRGDDGGNDDEQEHAPVEVGEYVLPPITTPSLMNGIAGEQSDYFSSALSAISTVGSSATSKHPHPLLPSFQYPAKKTMEEEDEDNRPLGARSPLPPPTPRKSSRHNQNSSSSDTLNPSATSSPPRIRDAGSVRSLPPGMPKGSSAPPRRAPLVNMLSPRPNPSTIGRPPSPAGSYAASSNSHYPVSPSSVGTRPMSPLSTSSHVSSSSKGNKLSRSAPLIKLPTREPIHLNPESESRSKSKTRAEPTIVNKNQPKEKERSGGMFSFIRDRKKSTATLASVAATVEGSRDSSEGNRPSFSSSKSEKSGLNKPRPEIPPPVPPLPSSGSAPLPPLRPIPVGEEFTRPSVVKGFVPPVRRQKLAPSNSTGPIPVAAAAGSATAPNQNPVKPPPTAESGTFELKAFRHVRPVSPGPSNGLNGPRPVSPGPFQGLELESANPRSRSRQDSVGSDTSATRTTVAAFRAAQQRRGTSSSTILDMRKSAADLVGDVDSPRRPSMTLDGNLGKESQTYLPLPGPPPPLVEPIRPFATRSTPGSPRGSLDGRGTPTTRPSTSPTQTRNTYGQLYSASTSEESESGSDSETDSGEEEADDDDDAPLGAQKRGPVTRQTTITEHKSNEFGVLREKPTAAPPSHVRSVAESSSTGTITPANAFKAGAAPIPRPKKMEGLVIPPPRSSSLVLDTLMKSSSSTTNEQQQQPPPSAGGQSTTTNETSSRALSMFSDLANYASSQASKSLGAVNLASLDPRLTGRNASGPPTAPRLPPVRTVPIKKHPETESTEDDDDEEESSGSSEDDGDDDDDDDAPLGNLVGRRPGSAMSHRTQQKQATPAPKIAVGGGQGFIKSALKKPPSSTSSISLASSPTASSPSIAAPPTLRPPRDARRPPPPSATYSAPTATKPKPAASQPVSNFRSLDNLPQMSLSPQQPMRPFALSNSIYLASPNGSSNGDSYSSIGGLPLTPRDGSEMGTTTSGSSALSGPVMGRPQHGRKGSVTFEEPDNDVPSNQNPEHRRKERRRSEAKNAIQMGNAINGPPPRVSDDDEDQVYGGQRGGQQQFLPQMDPSAMNMNMNMNPNMGMGMGWDPQLMMMLQAQQQQLVAMQAQMAAAARMTPDPSFMNAHQQAMLYAKQAYQLTVAQQAMEAAGDEWERSSNIGGPAASVYGGGGGSAYGGSTVGGSSMMGMPMMGMGMGMGGMGMPMMFPPATSVYGGSTAGSAYGGGGGRRPRPPQAAPLVSFPSSASNVGDAPERSKRSKTRSRTNTAPSNRNLPAQHTSQQQQYKQQQQQQRPPPPPQPPSSWRP